ncbi:MAG: helix-turn-helix domain-containing protein [Acidimicrobiia bacterium]|nr:helix-turn-helix domain-containing protein [Acidimicrobiia bacterium]
MFLCGPDTRSWSFELPPGTQVAGIRFRPGAAAGVLGVDAAEIRDQRVVAEDLLGGRAAQVLDERVAAGRDRLARMDVLEHLVRRREGDFDRDGTVELAALVAADPAYGVDRLAAETGVCSRQLRRRFDHTVGYGPAFFARIVRLQRFARSAARSPRCSIAELAVLSGYADQSHLSKDCRSIVAATPRTLIDMLPRTSLAVHLDEVRSVQDAAAKDHRQSAA